MIKKIILIVLLLVVGCEKETLEYKKDRKHYSSKTNKPYNGLWTTLYENGNKKSEGKYKDGKQDGPWTYWYENEQKKSEGTYKDGEKVGTWIVDGHEEVTLTPEQKREIFREEMKELLKQDKIDIDQNKIDIDQSKCNRKSARQFAYNEINKVGYGSGTDIHGTSVEYKDSPFFCRYKFTGTMFDRYNNPSFFSISVKYNGYSWNVENFDIQPW